jgi:hypothetical protein
MSQEKSIQPLIFNWLIVLANKILMRMSISPAPPLPGGRGAFTPTAWNIHCGHNAGLSSVAKGLAQMGVGLAVLMETKVMDNPHPRLALGYKILMLKATSHNQGWIALLWKENHRGYEVESVYIVTLNLLTFQLVTGDGQFTAWAYIAPLLTRWG